MNFKDKFKTFMGIDEDDFYDEEFELPPMQAPVRQVAPTNVAQVEQVARQPLRAVAVEPHPRQTNRDKGQVSVMNPSEMSKVIIREPKDYSDAQNIADCLKESLPVFVNLQRLDKGQGRRVIDFLSGCIYAVEGEIQKVGSNLFLLTPKSVETDGAVTETNDDLSLGEL